MAQKLISAKTTLGTNPRAQVRSFLVHINVAKVEIELSMIVAVRGACVEGGGGGGGGGWQYTTTMIHVRSTEA